MKKKKKKKKKNSKKFKKKKSQLKAWELNSLCSADFGSRWHFFDVLVARSSERMKEFLKMTWSYFGI